MKTKLKTRKSAVKRFKITKTGKIMRRRQYAGHLKAKKRKTRLYRQKEPARVSKADEKKIRRMLLA